MIPAPANIEELAEIIRSSEKVLAVGARTKPALSTTDSSVQLVSTRNLTGIVEYDPAEFTFTAKAGTPLREIVRILEERGQYLPFDPPLVESGATIGGTVAAGLSGPGRFRYGGIRDFILAVEFLDGNGGRFRGGAKVVKNAAGFDLPKFFTGSCGRFGVLTEVTFKVFPRPPATRSFRIPCATPAEAVKLIATVARSRREFDAIDYQSESGEVFSRMRGPADALDALAADLRHEFPRAESIGDAIWDDITELRFATGSEWLEKRPLTLGTMAGFVGECARAEIKCHVSGGGSFVWMHGGNLTHARHPLTSGTGCIIRNCARQPITAYSGSVFDSRLRDAFDPARRFRGV